MDESNRQLQTDWDFVDFDNQSDNDENTSWSIQSKMVGKPVELDSSFSALYGEKDDAVALKTSYAVFAGSCSSSSPFTFQIGGRSGKGAIGTPTGDLTSLATSINFSKPSEDGTIELDNEMIQENFFDIPSGSDFSALPFGYNGIESTETSEVQINCANNDDPADIIVLVRDDGKESVDATVSTDPETGEELIALTGFYENSQENLYVDHIESIGKGKGKKNVGGRRLSVIDSNTNSIKLRRTKQSVDEDNAPVVSLVQVLVKNSEGMKLPKTLVVRTQKKNRSPSQKIKLEKSEINEDGDVIFQFASPTHGDFGESIKVDARIGIDTKCNKDTIDVVDMSAILSTSSDLALTVNGGWFRRAVELDDINCDWEPVIVDAVMTDPQDQHTQIGRLDGPTKVNVMGNNVRHLSEDDQSEVNHRRRLLSAAPSSEELDINEEMMQGRRPKRNLSKSSRGLSGSNHKKILVHGWCAARSPFPLNQFSNDVEFINPDRPSNPQPESWSHDQFAVKILQFANNQGIDGCGIIAHSQGGLAALHLYTYYWSCLDYSTSGDRMIQSVGSPYQGTALQGNLAALGELFGVGCGSNFDLTEEGAGTWLSGIPTWARQNVYYYTTSFRDRWWAYDYCNVASDLLLWDPDDGVVSKSKGQLSGGNNMGHTTGECHSTGMRDPAQYLNSGRNSAMNSRARF